MRRRGWLSLLERRRVVMVIGDKVDDKEKDQISEEGRERDGSFWAEAVPLFLSLLFPFSAPSAVVVFESRP